MTDEQEAAILRLIRACMYPAEAARQMGFTSQALSMRKKRRPDFAIRIAEAEAQAEFGLLAKVLKGADADWRAAMAIMERRFKERWAKPELQAQLNTTNMDAETIAKAIHEGLAAVAKRHADFTQPDVDKDEGE